MKKIIFIALLAVMAANAYNPSITTSTPKDLFELGESIKYSHTISDKSCPFSIQYWIEDSEGEILKTARNTTNTNIKSYTPKEEGRIVLKAELFPLCDDTDVSDNHYEKTVEVVDSSVKLNNTIETNESISLNSTNHNSTNTTLNITQDVSEDLEVDLNMTKNVTNVTITNNTADVVNITNDVVLNETNVSVETNENVNNNNNNNLDVINESCNMNITIDVEKTLFQNGEKIEYKHILNENEVGYEIEYWIEDLFGKEVKKKGITKNTNKKSFTPKINEKDKTIILKAKVYSECGNATAERYVTVKNQDYVYVDYSKHKTSGGSENGGKPAASTETKETKKEDKKEKKSINSFYTLTKKYEKNKQIKIFASIEQKEGITARVNYGNRTEEIKINGKKAEINYTLEEGNNTVKLEILKEGEVIETQELSFYIEKSQNQTTAALNTKNKTTENLKNKKQILETQKVYSSSSFEASSIAKYTILFISVILNVVLIWRR